MDDSRFDAALRQVARARRPVLGLGLGTLLVAAGIAPGEARKKHKKHKRKDKVKRGTRECAVDADCTAGLRCDDGGRCLCDTQSNPGGCCSADRRTSFPGTSDSACGIDGNICQACQADFFCIAGSGICI